MRLVLYPLCELLHSGMVSERLHGVIASFEVCVANGHVDVSVAGNAQGDRPIRAASLELLPALAFALVRRTSSLESLLVTVVVTLRRR